MNPGKAFFGCDIFDGHIIHGNAALLVKDHVVYGIVPRPQIPDDFELISLSAGVIAPGLVDLQVNGGGGVLFNDEPTLSGIKTICNAHQSLGTTALLPTLITDSPDIVVRAIEAGIEAATKKVSGFLGLHLEGPHLAVSRKGAHPQHLIRPMDETDLQVLCDARRQLPNLMVTIAPEAVTLEQISLLKNAGVIISLGHTDTSAALARDAFKAGASCVTHLYNAMSGLSHREPGLVGAALGTPNLHVGLIADGLHVVPEAINIALRAKHRSSNLFLVSDSMSPAGTDLKDFSLNGRKVMRQDNRLTLADGTLAGADLDMVSAIRFMEKNTEKCLSDTLKMATTGPARCLQSNDKTGELLPGGPANFIHLCEDRRLTAVWVSGGRKWGA